MLSAMAGEDKADVATKDNPKNKNYQNDFKNGSLNGLRFGVYKAFLRDSLYKLNIEKISALGGVVVEIDPAQANIDGFGTILDADMKNDLPTYITAYGSPNLQYRTVPEIMVFNNKDSMTSIPYGQGRFAGIVNTKITAQELTALKLKVRNGGINYFEKPMEQYKLDMIVSIANYNAGQAGR